MKEQETWKNTWTLKAVLKGILVILLASVTVWGIFYMVKDSWYTGEDIFLVKEDGQYFFVNEENKAVKRAKFDYADVQRDNFFRICTDGRWGYLDSALTVNIEPQYLECGNFQEGLAPVRDGKYWKYINRQNEEAIHEKFEWAGEFANQKAVVKKDGKFIIIDETGKPLKGPFFACDRLFEDAYIVQESKQSERILLNQSLEEISLNEETMEEPIALKDGKLATYYIKNKSKKARLVDLKSGTVLLDGADAIAVALDGSIFYLDGKKWMIMNKEMKIVKKNVGESIIANSNGLFPVLIDRKWGAVDSLGRMKIKDNYEAMGPFSRGFSSVKSKGKWGIINLKGELVIPCEYEFAQFAL